MYLQKEWNFMLHTNITRGISSLPLKVITMKDKFFKLEYPKSFKVVPSEVRRIVQYIDNMAYADEPDYLYIQNSLKLVRF